MLAPELPDGDSFAFGTAGSVFEATHPSFAFQMRRVLSRDNVQIWLISVGHGWEVSEIMSDAPDSPV